MDYWTRVAAHAALTSSASVRTMHIGEAPNNNIGSAADMQQAKHSNALHARDGHSKNYRFKINTNSKRYRAFYHGSACCSRCFRKLFRADKKKWFCKGCFSVVHRDTVAYGGFCGCMVSLQSLYQTSSMILGRQPLELRNSTSDSQVQTRTLGPLLSWKLVCCGRNVTV
eukprot:5440083-Amphidinium_carterae.1